MRVQNKKFLYLLICLPALLLFGFFYYQYFETQRHTFHVTFLDIGQGDAALINFADGEKMLVDCGPSKIVLSALGRNMAFYDRTIDYVLATHPDLDHYGGCVDVVKNYHVKEIIVNGHEKPSDPYWREWDKVARESGTVVKVMNAPETWNIASTTLQFLSPDASLPVKFSKSDTNDYSIVFHLVNQISTYLFTGDMETPLEKALVEKYCSSSLPLLSKEGVGVVAGESAAATPSNLVTSTATPSSSPLVRGRGDDCSTLQSDILKVGHHGSDGSSSELFLSYVKSKIAVISVGPNKYGHPTLRAIKHLQRAGAQILRTDQLGDILEN